jgi:hypothetical protein
MNNNFYDDQLAFEKLKKTNGNGDEYWSAREIQTSLGYTSWKSFRNVIEKAKQGCCISGYVTEDHFIKITDIKPYSSRQTSDFQLSRYACYLIVQNGDPRIKAIALAQSYLASQTRKREVVNSNVSSGLALSWFCMTQADEKIKREMVKGKDDIYNLSMEIEGRVRQMISELGNSLPRNLHSS